jgi:hypothetical protein
MASIQCTDVQARPTEFLDFTSVTLDEFQRLVPPFEAAFQARMAVWRLDGKPRCVFHGGSCWIPGAWMCRWRTARLWSFSPP